MRPWATGNLAVRVDVEGCPCVDATFAEGALAPGLPRIIEITAGARAPGEWLGSINITARSTAPPPPPEEDEEAGEEGEGAGGEGAGRSGGLSRCTCRCTSTAWRRSAR